MEAPRTPPMSYYPPKLTLRRNITEKKQRV